MPKNATLVRDPVLVDLALQGGGSHGAFTWGVLDRFLEEPWLKIDGVSGTSAGAMNAAVHVHGHEKGGVAGAREALEAFLLLLALGTFLAGINTSLQIIFLGLAMALAVPAIVWLKQTALFLFLVAAAVIGIGLALWRR